MQVRILYFEGCPNSQLANDRVRAALGPDDRVTMQLITTPDEAEREGMHGSPTILVDGVDPFAAPGDQGSWSCRVYMSPDGAGASGVPSVEQIVHALGHTA